MLLKRALFNGGRMKSSRPLPTIDMDLVSDLAYDWMMTC